jgi:hypothetical protein
MSRMSDIDANIQIVREQLSGLVGCTIVQVDASAATETGSDSVWPVILVKDAKDNLFQLEIACDSEGNGPGHIFLGLISGKNFDDYTPISNQKSWEMLWDGV